MSIYSLTVKKLGNRFLFSCPKCDAPAMHALGAQNKDQLVYLLLCGKCLETLGEWTTQEEGDRELRQLTAKLLS